MVSKVLAVDDSAFMRNLLRQLLEDEHEVIDEAENGVEAVELHRKSEPDVAMMDVVMPIRNGVEATSETKSLDVGASAIVCMSVGREEKVREMVETRMDGYITRPLQKPDVFQTIADATQIGA